MLSTGEIIGIAVGLSQAILIFVKRDAIFKARASDSMEDLNDLIESDKSQEKEILSLKAEMKGVKESIASILLDNRKQEDMIILNDKALALMNLRITTSERLFEQMSRENAEFRGNLVENTHMIHGLKGTMEGVKGLLEQILKGKIRFHE